MRVRDREAETLRDREAKAAHRERQRGRVSDCHGRQKHRETERQKLHPRHETE